mmetsp:Transcript_34410/g.90531  ORF Transcript_34410/g.90531 Transcript_34410/m.90531 type:complete len:207 (-) Transcript_34410:1212-1832(-)
MMHSFSEEAPGSEEALLAIDGRRHDAPHGHLADAHLTELLGGEGELSLAERRGESLVIHRRRVRIRPEEAEGAHAGIRLVHKHGGVVPFARAYIMVRAYSLDVDAMRCELRSREMAAASLECRGQANTDNLGPRRHHDGRLEKPLIGAGAGLHEGVVHHLLGREAHGVELELGEMELAVGDGLRELYVQGLPPPCRSLIHLHPPLA